MTASELASKHGERVRRFAVIGTPVGHSLSPAMHNAVFGAADVNWEYEAIECPCEEDALTQIERLCSGELDGLNITMPYKRLALEQADSVDASARAAGGANVLARYDDGSLHAFNTDGLGAVDAVAFAHGTPVEGLAACVCGTGPTSCSIACALVAQGAARVTLFSRDKKRAQEAVEHIESCLTGDVSHVLRAASYEVASELVPACDVFIDATPRGMNADDEPIVDTTLFHQGQTILDVVYAHGVTRLVAGAREQGAQAIDGGEMLVGQAVLSDFIWQKALGVSFDVERATMSAVL